MAQSLLSSVWPIVAPVLAMGWMSCGKPKYHLHAGMKRSDGTRLNFEPVSAAKVLEFCDRDVL
jgi:hypothetical protein